MRSKLWSEQPGRPKDGHGRFGIEAVKMGSTLAPKGELQGPASRLYVPALALQPRGGNVLYLSRSFTICHDYARMIKESLFAINELARSMGGENDVAYLK